MVWEWEWEYTATVSTEWHYILILILGFFFFDWSGNQAILWIAYVFRSIARPTTVIFSETCTSTILRHRTTYLATVFRKIYNLTSVGLSRKSRWEKHCLTTHLKSILSKRCAFISHWIYHFALLFILSAFVTTGLPHHYDGTPGLEKWSCRVIFSYIYTSIKNSQDGYYPFLKASNPSKSHKQATMNEGISMLCSTNYNTFATDYGIPATSPSTSP